jgi:hypothetical protein
MPPVPPATEFENPLTDTRYRLCLNGPTWRITKSTTTTDGYALLRHLRGTTASDVSPPAEDLDRLVRGEHQVGANLAADPQLTFAEAILLDLDRTADHLTTMAHRARLRRERGAPGFRAGCSALRDQERRCMEAALGGCRELGAAWMASGLGATAGLPALPACLASAVDDASQVTAAGQA